MADDYDDSDFDGDGRDRTNDEWAKLRQARKEAKTAEAERDAAKRELAFLKAGINPDDQRMGYFVRGYTGEVSAEAIRDAAIAAGFMQPPGAPDPATQQAVGAQQRMAVAASAGVPAEASMSAAEARLVEAMEQGGPAAMLQALIAEGGTISAER